VPQSALIKRGSTWRVFAVVDNALEERVVQLGPKVADDRVAITRGLATGDQVAIDATPETADGVALR
jgi:multidrug efflux pump subunit AcrA (membrane-fusion protein)